MRNPTRWLALVLVGACGTTASAQAPPMAGMPYYPPYPYAQPMPNYSAPRGYAPPPYYPQPQPRVLYVPATPPPWESGPAPAPSSIQPVQNATSATAAPTEANDGKPRIVYDTIPDAKAPAKATSAKIAALRNDLSLESTPAACCQPECVQACPAPCAAPPACPQDDNTIWLPRGACDVQILGGVYSDVGKAHYNFAQTDLRLGKILGTGCLCDLPGAFEALIEVNGASTIDADFGSWFIGGGLLLRYNCVHPGSRLVPYVQGGVGMQYNDAYRDPNQPYLGSHVELTAQAQVGLRFFMSKRCSLDVEGGAIHISDLGMSHRDEGINALGGMAGLTYYFPCGGRR